MSKGRKVTDKGVVKESSKIIQDRETSREHAGKWPEQPRKKEISIDLQHAKVKKKPRKKS
jgi:hypothetical protein